MSKKIGLIQTRGIGDIIIALPIADFYLERGFEVVWPIDERWVEIFRRVKPHIQFEGVTFKEPLNRDYFVDDPLRITAEHGCERVIILYSYLGDLNVCDRRLAASLKFDEYKYAIAGVPFKRKWTLKLERDMAREQALFDSLNIQGSEYVCVHAVGSDLRIPIRIEPEIEERYHVIQIEELTDSPFDWLLTLERASKLILIDSCFSNLVEQLNMTNEKRLVVRSPIQFTPVYKNGWRFVFFDPADAT
jgi:hypothetical protein